MVILRPVVDAEEAITNVMGRETTRNAATKFGSPARLRVRSTPWTNCDSQKAPSMTPDATKTAMARRSSATSRTMTAKAAM